MINILLVVLLVSILLSVWVIYFKLRRYLNVILDKIDVTNELIVMPDIKNKNDEGEIDYMK